MKTVRQALLDSISYPINEGLIENKAICRGLELEAEFTAEIAKQVSFIGCEADCLYALLLAPNISEADKSASLPDRATLLRIVNAKYASIGEASVTDSLNPTVTMGDDVWQS